MKLVKEKGLYVMSLVMMMVVFPLFFWHQRNSSTINYTIVALIYVPIVIISIGVVLDIIYMDLEQSIWQKTNTVIIMGIYACLLSYITAIERLKNLYCLAPLITFVLPFIYYQFIKRIRFKTVWKLYLVKYAFVVVNLFISLGVYYVMSLQ
jgi:hypothetical protein